MPVNPALTSRSGMTQFMKFAQTLCRLVNLSAPVIRIRYADRTALLAVLTAAESVCDLLPAALAEQAAEDELSPAAFDPADGTPFPGEVAP